MQLVEAGKVGLDDLMSTVRRPPLAVLRLGNCHRRFSRCARTTNTRHPLAPSLPVTQHVDPMLEKMGLPGLVELFGVDHRIEKSTVRDFLGMVAGTGDYDDEDMRVHTINNPDDDITPKDWLLAKTWREKWHCRGDPGVRTCGTGTYSR